MRRFVEGADRGQSTLLPECLDDWIDEDNPVRVIDAFVEALDLAELGFEGVDPAATGRPSYHPSVLLKLYIYGYLNRVQSSRRLEREAGRNVEVMWLLGRLAPDHKTIADFRKDNGAALRKVCALRRTVPRDGSSDGDERRHRRQQVQGGEQPGQELHTGEGGAAARAARGERRALSEPARHGRPAGADGGAGREGDEAQREADEVAGADGQACGVREADACFARSANLSDRPGQSLDGNERPRLWRRRLQRSGGCRHRTSSDCDTRGDEQRLGSGATCQYCQAGEGCPEG